MTGFHDRERRRERRRRRDEIAARAARAWFLGEHDSIADAIDESCGVDAKRHATRPPRPGDGRVRLHLRACAESALGREGRLQRVAEVLGHAVAAMEALASPPIAARTTLAGRATRGQVEDLLAGGGRLHLRTETGVSIGGLAACLVEAGFDEPSFDSFEARGPTSGCGRLHRLSTGRDGVAISLVRCPPAQIVPGDFDLVRGQRATVLDLQSLRCRVGALLEGRDPF